MGPEEGVGPGVVGRVRWGTDKDRGACFGDHTLSPSSRCSPTVTVAVRSRLPFRAVLVFPAVSQRNGRVLR